MHVKRNNSFSYMKVSLHPWVFLSKTVLPAVLVKQDTQTDALNILLLVLSLWNETCNKADSQIQQSVCNLPSPKYCSASFKIHSWCALDVLFMDLSCWRFCWIHADGRWRLLIAGWESPTVVWAKMSHIIERTCSSGDLYHGLKCILYDILFYLY